MLKNLLKYDLKWTYKPLIVFYILAIIFSILGRGLSSIENSLIFDVLGKICTGAAISMMISIMINNFMRVWVRFIRNVYKDESYLTHTLPVSKGKIYLSKILSAIIVLLTSALVILLCIVILYYSKENLDAIKASLEAVAINYDSSVISLLSVCGIVVFLEVLFAIFSGYIGIIIAHKSNNMKIVKSIIFGGIAYFIPSMLTLLVIFIIGLFNTDVMNMFNTVSTLSIDALKIVLFGGMFMYVIYLIFYYILGKKLFEKGVNVD